MDKKKCLECQSTMERRSPDRVKFRKTVGFIVAVVGLLGAGALLLEQYQMMDAILVGLLALGKDIIFDKD